MALSMLLPPYISVAPALPHCTSSLPGPQEKRERPRAWLKGDTVVEVTLHAQNCPHSCG